MMRMHGLLKELLEMVDASLESFVFCP